MGWLALHRQVIPMETGLNPTMRLGHSNSPVTSSSSGVEALISSTTASRFFSTREGSPDRNATENSTRGAGVSGLNTTPGAPTEARHQLTTAAAVLDVAMNWIAWSTGSSPKTLGLLPVRRVRPPLK